MTENTNPVLEVAKEQRGDDVVTLSTGIRVRFKSVNPATIADIISRIQEPAVPMWLNEKKGREEPNPMDPSYLRAIERIDEQRGAAMMDALALFGLELVDGVPDDDEWLKELRLMERLGHVDLSMFDLDDTLDREFIYRKHIAIGTEDWTLLMTRVGITPEGIRQAEDSFPGN